MTTGRMALLALISCASCRGSEAPSQPTEAAASRSEDPAPEVAPKATPANDPPALVVKDPLQGPLTAERILATAAHLGVDHVIALANTPWNKTMPLLEAVLGTPTMVDGDRYGWAVAEGERCTFFVVVKQDLSEHGADLRPYGLGPGDGTHLLQGEAAPGTVTSADPRGWSRCIAAAGGDAGGGSEDGPGPDGDEPITVRAMLEGLGRAPRAWKDRPVRVSGVLLAGSAATAAGPAMVIIAMPDDPGAHILCRLAGEAPHLATGTAVIAAGRVFDDLGGGLNECRLTAR